MNEKAAKKLDSLNRSKNIRHEIKKHSIILTTFRSIKKLNHPYVPSACVNCKISHSACDVSRPCKRCLSSNKADTCHDQQHRKRGRRKTHQEDTNYSILSGTIQTPAIPPNPKDTIIQQQKPVHLPTPFKHSITLILSMEICCAKVTDETIPYWGYYPQELLHRSFYDFISPQDFNRLAKLHRQVIDHSMNYSQQPLPSTSMSLNHTDYKQLCIKANGAKSFSDKLHIKKRTGEFELYEVEVYIGGGLGADLTKPCIPTNPYIVAQFKKYEKINFVNYTAHKEIYHKFINITPSFANDQVVEEPTTSNNIRMEMSIRSLLC